MTLPARADPTQEVELVEAPHALRAAETLERLRVDQRGLSRAEAAERPARFGPNALPHELPAGVFRI